MNNPQIIDFARSIINTERDAIDQLLNFVDDKFAEIAKLIYQSNGRLIITGIGKSAIIANKIVATLNSTGTPAIFMHAADAIHGDLGLIQNSDIIICISKSGNSPEIKVLIPFIKNMGNTVIGMVGNMESYLATASDYVINTTVAQEACPNNLAPTSSTTAQLVMGDALSMVLLKMRGFTAADFARFHPGGALGKKLYTRVRDLLADSIAPAVQPSTPLKQIIIEISLARLGATAVVDDRGKLCGIITDGDLRRMLQSGQPTADITAQDIMSQNPKSIDADQLAINAYKIMESNKITQLLVTEHDRYVGVVHLHDILREGVV